MLASMACLLFTATVQAKKSSALSSVVGDGKTLPKKVIRGRVVTSTVVNSKTFDKDGNKFDSGLSLKATGGALVFEYGLVDNVSVQLLQKMMYSATWELDQETFKRSALYRYKQNFYRKELKEMGVPETIMNLPPSQIPETIEALKQLKQSLLAGKFIYRGTGETLAVDASKTINENLDDLILKGAQSAPNGGGFRLGDLEIGARYSVFNDKNLLWEGLVHVAIGLGLRLPVGEHPTPSGKIPSGTGLTDLGVRFNVDVYVNPFLVLSWENQTELMLVKGKYKKTSLKDNQVFNTESPIDGSKNDVDYKKTGLGQVGSVKANMGLAALSSKLGAVTCSVSYQYRLMRKEVYKSLDDEYKDLDENDLIGTGGVSHGWEARLGFDGLVYKLPLQVEVAYSDVLSAKSQLFATSGLEIQLKMYYKF